MQVLSEHNYDVLDPKKLIQQQRCQIRKLESQVKQLSEEVYALRRQNKRKTESHDKLRGQIGKSGAYTDYIMDFSFRMFFISPKGYIFLRDVLERALPHPTTFSRWKKPIDTRPGNMSLIICIYIYIYLPLKVTLTFIEYIFIFIT